MQGKSQTLFGLNAHFIRHVKGAEMLVEILELNPLGEDQSGVAQALFGPAEIPSNTDREIKAIYFSARNTKRYLDG